MQSLLFSFNGRINRAKWWLVNIVATVVYLVVIAALGGGAMMSGKAGAGMGSMGAVGGIIVLVLSIAVIWISLAVAAKRWHDRGKSAWWILIVFVPVVGSLWYLIECGFLPGTSGANAYGSDPLGTL